MSSKINKIVELQVEIDDISEEEFEDVGIEIMSLVEEPAIGVHWAVFAAEQFVDKLPGESEDKYLGRCIPQLIKEGYDEEQATAICYNSFKEDQRKDEFEINTDQLPDYTDQLFPTKALAEEAAKAMGCSGSHTHDVEGTTYYMPCETHDEMFLPENPCTAGYVAYGTKIKNGREVPNCIPITNSMEFESFTDYPEGARNNAKRAIEWKEENGSDCGTQVGWTRARQLADGKPISEETIARMASFERHRQHSDVPYTEGCGGIMWDAWGGDSGIRWAQTKLNKIREEKLQKAILEMASQSDFGEVLDIELTSYVNLSKTNFETIGEYLRGADALDVLSRISANAGEEVPEQQFRYTGPSAQRNFCRALLALGKIYTRSEINRMNSINSGFAEAGKFSYSVFEYAGGVNCTHWFEAVRVFRGLGGRNVVISEGPAAGDAGKSQNSKQPSPTGYVRNNARMSSEWKFAEDDDQMVITGPAMKAFQMIPRRDEDGNVFHVYFSDETIKKLSEKFLKQHKQHMTDIDHSMEATEENTLLESWIVEDPEMDKAKALGFNPAKGDWYVSYKINNKETWELIKEGKLNGFSIAGQFLERNAK
jgi:hypothetical protein